MRGQGRQLDEGRVDQGADLLGWFGQNYFVRNHLQSGEAWIGVDDHKEGGGADLSWFGVIHEDGEEEWSHL